VRVTASKREREEWREKRRETEGDCERQKERESERERQREREIDRQTERQRDKQRERESERERDRGKASKREREHVSMCAEHARARPRSPARKRVRCGDVGWQRCAGYRHRRRHTHTRFNARSLV